MHFLLGRLEDMEWGLGSSTGMVLGTDSTKEGAVFSSISVLINMHLSVPPQIAKQTSGRIQAAAPECQDTKSSSWPYLATTLPRTQLLPNSSSTTPTRTEAPYPRPSPY